uniref:Secreted protein n=1 Tax=Plectus sambesii TaxID=2011161 RepID=A0A914XP35_9BILA
MIKRHTTLKLLGIMTSIRTAAPAAPADGVVVAAMHKRRGREGGHDSTPLTHYTLFAQLDRFRRKLTAASAPLVTLARHCVIYNGRYSGGSLRAMPRHRRLQWGRTMRIEAAQRGAGRSAT